MTALIQDVRLAFRTLRRSFGFAAVVVLTLAIGITANTVSFSFIHAFLLAPLPYPEGDELAFVWTGSREDERGSTVAAADYTDWRAQSRSFTDLAAFNVSLPFVTVEGRAYRVEAAVTTPNYFDLLRVPPALGRPYTEEDVRLDRDVVVASYTFWRDNLGADEGAVGRDLLVNDIPHTLIGVMPEGFRHPEMNLGWEADLLRPLTISDNRRTNFLRVLGRIQPGTTFAQAAEEMASISARLEEAYPETNRGRVAVVRGARDEFFGEVRTGLLLLLGACLLVLAVVAVNTLTLVLARNERRGSEIAVRAAVGAGRGRLLRHLATEMAVLVAFGAAVGVGVAFLASGWIRSVQRAQIATLVDAELSLPVLGFTVLIGVVVALVAGVLPAAWSSKPDYVRIRSGARAGGGPAQNRRRWMLVGAQLSVTTVLLVTTGLLTRSFMRLVSAPIGVSQENVAVFDLFPSGRRYPEAAQVAAYYDRVRAQLESTPGVEGVAFVSDLPFTAENRGRSFTVVGRPARIGEEPSTEYREVSVGYFDLLGVPIVEGRSFAETDRLDTPLVAVVNRRFEETHFPDDEVVGARIEMTVSGDTVQYTVVGVAGDVLDDGFGNDPDPLFYIPYSQSRGWSRAVLVRTVSDPEPFFPQFRARVAEIDPQVPFDGARSMRDMVRATVAQPRSSMLVVGGFGLMALLLSAIGVYGVIQYGVSNRRKEMGIRMALGARPDSLVGLFVGESFRVVLVSVGLGWVASVFAARLLSGYLYQVSAWDPWAFWLGPLCLFATAVTAAYLPARRGARADPIEAMRQE